MPRGVALAMRHGLEWFIHLQAQRPQVGDEHPAYAPAGAWLPLPLVTEFGFLAIRLTGSYCQPRLIY